MIKNRLTYLILSFCLITLSLVSCEKTIEIEIPGETDKLVVECFLDPDVPFIYMLLTKNSKFFDTLNSNFENLFVHDAQVIMKEGGNSDTLFELCGNQIPPAQLEQFLAALGLPPGTPATGICVYVSLSQPIAGRTYKIEIETDTSFPYPFVRAQTTIPGRAKVDSVWVVEDPIYPGFYSLWGIIDDPDSNGNAYRFFTSINSDREFAGPFGSVFDDEIFNGTRFASRFDNGASQSFGGTSQLFKSGDTVTLAVAMIEGQHYDFWRTKEDQEFSGSGPFGSPVFVRSNIENGLGIFGSYHFGRKTVIIP